MPGSARARSVGAWLAGTTPGSGAGSGAKGSGSIAACDPWIRADDTAGTTRSIATRGVEPSSSTMSGIAAVLDRHGPPVANRRQRPLDVVPLPHSVDAD